MRKTVERVLFLVLSAGLFLYGFVSGWSVEGVVVNIYTFAARIFLLDAAAANIVFTGFLTFTGGLLLLEVYWPRNRPHTTDGGEMIAVIPVYNDAAVLHRSVESLANSHYENLRIIVVCEEEDRESREAAAALPCEVMLNKHPGSKAGAINTVFEEADADLYAVFDADEVVDPGFLPTAAGYITEDGFDAFQGRRIPAPTGVVEAFSYAERVLFHAAYKFTEFSGLTNIRSSSTVMKRSVWEAVEGYDELLTEDMDFPHKCFRNHIAVKQDRACANVMEAPHTWRDFWGQRKRWRIGQIQLLHKALNGGYTNNVSYRGFVSMSNLVLTVLLGVFLLILVPKFFILLLLGVEIYLLPLLAPILLVALLSLRDTWKENVSFTGWKTVLAPVVLPITGFLMVKSLLEYVLTWEGEWYTVEKTGD